MHDDFEMTGENGELARRLAAYADIPIRRTAANVAAVPGWAGKPRTRRGVLNLRLPALGSVRPALIIALLLALAAATLLGVGMLPRPDPMPLGRLVYAASDGGLFVADADARGARRIRDGRFSEPMWSVDGRYVAVLRDPTAVDILRADGSLVEEIANTPSPVSAAWAPGESGRSLLAVQTLDSLAIRDVDGGTTALLEGPVDTGTQFIAWVSGSTFLWTNGFPRGATSIAGGAARVDTSGPNLRIVPTREIEWMIPPIYRGIVAAILSPDGTMLAATLRLSGYLASDLVLLPLDGGPIRVIAEKIEIGSWLAWSADSRSVLCEAIDKGQISHVDVVPIDGSAARPLFDQRLMDNWLLAGHGPFDLATGRVLLGAATSTPERPRLTSAKPTMDLFVLDPGASAPRWIQGSVLGADVVWR